MTKIAVGYVTACAVGKDGAVYCWGSGAFGVLGRDPGSACNGSGCSRTPLAIAGLPPIDEVSVGNGAACAVSKDHRLFCWGSNGDGLLGLGTIDGNAHPQPAEVVAIGAGVDEVRVAGNDVHHACARKGDRVFCWGSNDSGESGHAAGGTNDLPCGSGSKCTATPTEVKSATNGDFTGVVDIALPSAASCVVKSDAKVYCWGDNRYGQFGTTAASRSSPDVVPNLDAVNAISGIYQPFCALDGGSVVWCWGANEVGQLGIGEVGAAGAGSGRCYGKPCYTVPKQVSTVRATQISADNGAALALDTEGKVWSWGQNPWGQLGREPASSQQSCSGVVPCTPTPAIITTLP